MATILVVSEVQDGKMKSVSTEVFTAAVKMAGETGNSVTALFVGNGLDGLADSAGKFGVADVVLAEGASLAKFSPDAYAAAIAEVAKQKDTAVILMSATYTGKDLLARTAQILDTGLAQDCISYRAEGGKLYFTRPVYAGKLLAEVRVDAAPVMATFRPKSFKPAESPVAVKAEKLSLDLPAPKAVLEEMQLSGGGKMDVTEADMIVSGGRGMKGPENWGILEELAEVLGAATGCSRPVSDDGWRPHEEHIGQTGRTVSPTLYVACGISGAIQHLAGMSSSKFIVAINKDEEAPIFKAADYGIVGDVFEVLPALTAEIRKLKQD